MNTKIKFCIIFFAALGLAANLAYAVKVSADGKIIPDKRGNETVKIDGELNEKLWSNPAIEKEFLSYEPAHGSPIGQKTKIWTAYDKNNLYFAFICYDTNPDNIKTSICQRDKIFNDDFVGISIDTNGSRQSAYEFYVNPSGIQADSLLSSVTASDFAPDFVWDSAAKLTENGYQVEIRIPLKSIQFKSGKNLEMGIMFLRAISMEAISGSWPTFLPGQTEFNCMAGRTFEKLKKPLQLEILPSFVYSKDSLRENNTSWTNNTVKDFGISIKYGITSSITAEATVNPDFSQVESDIYQVEVNQRYPIFYSEKRPFFMEGIEKLDFPYVPFGLMGIAVHTRNIVDPLWAAKLSGTLGKKVTFAMLTSEDDAPGQVWSDGSNPDEGKKAFFGIARAKYNLGSDNHIGILYTGRHFAGGKNDVVGTDLKYRLFKNTRFTLSYMGTNTKETNGVESQYGNGFTIQGYYFVKKFFASSAFERYDDKFYMASAFQLRTNASSFRVFVTPRLTIKGLDWVKLVRPFLLLKNTHDLATKMNDKFLSTGVMFNFTKRGYLEFELRLSKEAWAGELFTKNYFKTYGWVQLYKWLFLNYSLTLGDEIYYDARVDSFVGNVRTFETGFTLQPNTRLNLDFGYTRTQLSTKTGNERVYAVDIFNANTSYQFNKYFFVRAVLRYNNMQ
ncbi:MAG: carbohydrate binding family 9 domain-containing protein, partial [bacterium]|nr:carbohydrate binding family 9 domain-containing protein [bacterium]